MRGLKNVRYRYSDALAQVPWERLEVMLADHYRAQGWQVEHVGTGSGHGRFDGGVDLKLRKHAQYVVVQCKHWNAKQVTHNTIHELLGIKVNEGATAAIVISSGEFTPAARQAASRHNHIQVIDGSALRSMLGSRMGAMSVAGPPLRPAAAAARKNGVRTSTRRPITLLGVSMIFSLLVVYGLSVAFRATPEPFHRGRTSAGCSSANAMACAADYASEIDSASG